MDRHDPTTPRDVAEQRDDERKDSRDRTDDAPNPPHTTTGKVTSPKFGSAGSEGLEYEGASTATDDAPA